jgi:uncharacterized membrane protein YjgN (DUF898 family)
MSVVATADRTRPDEEKCAHRIVFTATGSAYFRIWIVNLLLKFLTLGLYSPWARRRCALYLCANTSVDGIIFAVRGNPWIELKSILLKFVIPLLSLAASRVPQLWVWMLPVALAALPFVLVRARILVLSVVDRDTVYFYPVELIMGAVENFLLWPLARWLTLGPVMPRAHWNVSDYFCFHRVDRVAEPRFKSSIRTIWRTFFKSILLAASIFSALTLAAQIAWRNAHLTLVYSTFFGVTSLYISSLFFSRSATTTFVKSSRHEFFSLGILFEKYSYFKMQISNAICIFATGGLFLPWARVRRLRLLAACTRVTVKPGVEHTGVRSAVDGEFATSSALDFEAARLTVHAGSVAVTTGAGTTIHRFESLRFASRLERRRGINRQIIFQCGAKFDTSSAQELDEMFARAALSRHERTWRAASVPLGLVVLIVSATVGVTMAGGTAGLAYAASTQVPASVEADLVEHSMAWVEASFAPSELPLERQAAIRTLFATRAGQEHLLEFRSSPDAGAHAFALLGGTIVITDELVATAGHDDEILAVLAHELGHVQKRHMLRLLLESKGVLVPGAIVVGELDVLSDLWRDVPPLLDAQFNEELEDEANEFAIKWLTARNIDPHRFHDVICRGQEDERQPFSFLALHRTPCTSAADVQP